MFNTSKFVIEGSYFLLFISKQMSISTNNLNFTDVLDLATMLLLPFKEGRTIVENRTADIIQETRKLHIRKKGSGSEPKHQATNIYTRKQTSMQAQMEPQLQADQEIQLKASRDVRWQLCITSSYNEYILHVLIALLLCIYFSLEVTPRNH